MTNPAQLIQAKHDLQLCYALMHKNFWFHSRGVLVGLRSFKRFLRGAIFFVFPWVKDDFGWTNWQVQHFFYFSATESNGNANCYSKHDFEKSRKHSYILYETQLGLTVLLRKHRDSRATGIHYRERTDKRLRGRREYILQSDVFMFDLNYLEIFVAHNF